MSNLLVHNVIEAHGGLKLWNQIEKLRLRLRVGGNLLASKFQPPGARRMLLEVDTRRIHARLTPFPRPDCCGIFEERSVRIETDGGVTVKEREIARDAADKVRRRFVWDELDLLYFLGYALWNYTMTPFYFLWPGFECREGELRQQKDGSPWRTLRVTYPEAFPTHSRQQTFYFDQQGLLKRLDYTAYVFNDWTHGAHYCFDHRNFGGLICPTHRVVFPRLPSGRPFRWFRAMEGWVDDLEVVREEVAKSGPLR